MPKLGDEHRKVPALIDGCRAAGLPVGTGQRADPARVGAAELEQDARKLLVRIGRAAQYQGSSGPGWLTRTR